jgi:hypothetical protein
VILHGDCLGHLKSLPEDSLDSMVTDPPAGIGFMGKDWDHHKGGRDAWVAWMTEVMRECLRVLKPGAHALVWAIPRTSHWTATALEDAGFEIRDVVTHLFGTGFPKSLDVSKAIDKAAGAEREIVGEKPWSNQDTRGNPVTGSGGRVAGKQMDKPRLNLPITAPATDAARQWQGFGTALKPACEFWILCRKPIAEKTVAANVLKHGTGALNIDGCRIAGAIPQVPQPKIPDGDMLARGKDYQGRNGELSRAEGRFPANLVFSCECDTIETSHGQVMLRTHDGACPVAMLDEQSGHLPGPWGKNSKREKPGSGGYHGVGGVNSQNELRGMETGGASRFFYCAKASKADRERKAKA